MDFKIYFAVDIPKLWDILYILFNLEVYMELKIYFMHYFIYHKLFVTLSDSTATLVHMYSLICRIY